MAKASTPKSRTKSTEIAQSDQNKTLMDEALSETIATGRHVIQINSHTFARLKTVSTQSGKPMSAIVQYLLNKGEMQTLIDELKDATIDIRRGGRPKKSFF